MVVVCDICGKSVDKKGFNVRNYWLEFWHFSKQKEIDQRLDLCKEHAEIVRDKLWRLIAEIKKVKEAV